MTTSKALWEKKVSRTITTAPAIPDPSGKKIDCLNGCGNKVSTRVMVCRSCKRKAKIANGRAELKARKAQRKVKAES